VAIRFAATAPLNMYRYINQLKKCVHTTGSRQQHTSSRQAYFSPNRSTMWKAILLSLLIPVTSGAQVALQSKSEVTAILGSGYFSLAGSGAAPTTVIEGGPGGGKARTYNPYGSHKALCYGLHAGFRRISTSHLVFGLEAGMEELRSRIEVDRIFGGGTGTARTELSAEGNAYLSYRFFNFAPFVGYRHLIKGLAIDYTGGLDLAHCFGTRQTGRATDANGTEYTISGGGHAPVGDIRLRVQVSTYYHRFGIFGGYSTGLTAYLPENTGSRSNFKARLIRFGLSYRVN
jgi:hypothetical protein